MRVSSVRRAAAEVRVRVVMAGRPSATTVAKASSGIQASMALPTAVQYIGARLPIREAIRTAVSFSTLST